jgi:protein-S-isoprenylcysteine O-methyltransferase Ste14
MYVRALIAFLTLPGIFGGLVPALLATSEPRRGDGSVFGFVVLLLGLFLLLWCAREFFVFGRGTLAPWDPPKHLVVAGLYRFVRNPMYIAVLILVLGWSLAIGSRWLAWYAGILAFAFHLQVVFHEEPWLLRQFGAEWLAYSASVPRWIPRLSYRREEKPTKPGKAGDIRK